MASGLALNSNQSSSAAAPSAAGDAAKVPGSSPSCEHQQVILSNPYQLASRAAQLRQEFSGSIGWTVQSRGLGSNRLWLNANDIQKSAECLGFEKITEEAALAQLPPPPSPADGDSCKIHLAITIAKNSPALSGPGYLIFRPFVEPMHQLCSKWLLVLSMGRLEARLRQAGTTFLRGSGLPFGHEEFTAFTVNLSNANLESILASRPGTYLAKPVRGTMGQRQHLVRLRPGHIQQDLLEALQSSQLLSMRRAQVILQRYIEQPLLIDKRKFDMRVYYLVVNAKRAGDQQSEESSGYFAFLHPGFVRLCTAPYSPSDPDLAVHLTNQSVQARHSSTFAELKEVTTWYPDELNAYLNRRRRLPRRDWARDVLYPKVAAILGYISALYRRHLDDRDFPAGSFRVLGVDMLVDAELRVHLLEFNEFPAWGRQTSVLRVVKPNLWLEAACLVSEVALRYQCRRPIGDGSQLVAMQNFRLIYSSEDPELARRNVARLYQ